ncbi:MAG: hypothetical protein ACLFNK_02490 [Candidatus Woesearchaeota archaeon]
MVKQYGLRDEPKQYELWEELEDDRIMDSELKSIDDAIESADAPEELKSSLSGLARSMRRGNPRTISIIPPESSILNYRPEDRLPIMRDRIHTHLGHSTEDMSPKQIYGKYFSSLESEKYHKS